MLWACGLVTLVGVATAVVLAIRGLSVPSWATLTLAGLTLPLVGATVVIRWQYWRIVSNGVEITARQLPAVHAIFSDLITAIGLTHTPRLYVQNGQGQVNAAASKCRVRHGYVVITSDLLEVGLEGGDWETVRFALAHELAHIACGHVALWRTAITTLPRLIRLDRSLIRAQEYTADRVAALHAPAGATGMLVLYAGKRLYRHLDIDAHLASIASHRDGLWLRVANLASTHPVGWRRLQPLARVNTDGWDIHGRMV